MTTDYEVKQVIVIRKDLNMRKGKMCAQAAHASMKFLVDLLKDKEDEDCAIQRFLSDDENNWLFNGRFAKIVVSVDSEQELLDLVQRAEEQGIRVSLIQDAGFTEFNNVPTYTCAAFGPIQRDRLDKLTGHLKLL